MTDTIVRLFEASIAAQRSFLDENLETLTRVIDAVAGAFADGRKLLLFGNGGSASDARHLAAEFVNRFGRDRRPLPALALTADEASLTGIANDYGYDDVFARQIEALGAPGDVALAISTSGNSRNVLQGLAACRELGVTAVGLSGGTGGKMAPLVDYLLCVSATTETARIQETHLLVGHVLCEMVERKLYPD